MASEVKQQMEGKWTVYKSENYEKYLDALGKCFDYGFH